MNPFDFAMAEAKRQGIDPALVMRVLMAESSGNPNAISNKGARGYMQLRPGTAKEMGVNINDPFDNIRGGVGYLAKQLKSFGGDEKLALAAYNAGPGNVRKYGGIPPFAETQNYVKKIQGGTMPIQRAQAKQSGDELFAHLLGGSAPAQEQNTGKEPKSGDELFAHLLSDKPASGTQQVANTGKRKPLPSIGGGTIEIEPPSAMASIGRGMMDIVQGGKQMYNRAAPWVSKKESQAYDKELSDEMRLYEKGRGKDAGADFGRIGGNIAFSAPAFIAPGAQGIGAQALIGGAANALQPIDTQRPDADFAGEKAGQLGLGALLGGGAAGVAKALGKFIKPTSGTVDAGRQSGIDAADRLGINLTAGQKTGSLGLQQLESVLSRTPGAAGLAKVTADKNKAALNEAAAKAIGLPTGQGYGTLSEASLGAAKNNIGDMFQQSIKGADVPLGGDFFNKLAAVDSQNRSLGAFMNPQVDDLVTKGLAMAAQGTVKGEAYQTIRSTLSKRASDAFKSGNSDLGQALKSVRDGLDDAAKGALTPEKKAMFSLAQKQYGDFKTLIKGNVVSGGDVNPTLVKNALQQFNPTTFKTGQMNSGLTDIAKIGEIFKNSVANSGTPERSAMHNMLFGNPLTGVPMIAGSYAMQKTLQNPLMQKYLVNGLFPLTQGAQGNMAQLGGLLGSSYSGNLQR
jgi:hypothetical protein